MRIVGQLPPLGPGNPQLLTLPSFVVAGTGASCAYTKEKSPIPQTSRQWLIIAWKRHA